MLLFLEAHTSGGPPCLKRRGIQDVDRIIGPEGAVPPLFGVREDATLDEFLYCVVCGWEGNVERNLHLIDGHDGKFDQQVDQAARSRVRTQILQPVSFVWRTGETNSKGRRGV